MTKIRFISVAECDYGFKECMGNEDFENASSYYESLKFHYQSRGKRIKELQSNNKKLKIRSIVLKQLLKRTD